MASEEDPVTYASELGEYAYCRRSWWLGRVCGLPSANLSALSRGRASHGAHARRARRAARLRGLAVCGLLAAASLITIGVYMMLTATGGSS